MVRSHDPVAVAVANASLLGIGYWMLGRRTLAVVTELITVALIALLAASAETGTWFEIVVVLWWVTVIGHGWFLARRNAQRVTVRWQRLVAVAAAVPVLLVVGLLRYDAVSIGHTVADARQGGDCPRAMTALHRVWFGPRVADAPLAARDDKTAEACHRLKTAQKELAAGSASANGAALQAGVDGLTRVLADYPGHAEMVQTVLNDFLDGLPTTNPCRTAAITDWLRQHRPSDGDLPRISGVVARTAPAALVGCGDDLMAAKNWGAARTRYQQLVHEYPGQHLVATARAGVKRATLAIELDNVRHLLADPVFLPDYCDHPARYSGAPPYRKGLSRALFFAADGGSDQNTLDYGGGAYTNHVPRQWQTKDVTHAALVICAGAEKDGAAVQSCPYENKRFPDFPTTVTFHKIAIPVRAYELRTGKLVVNTTVQIGGASCPDHLRYSDSVELADIGPPSHVYVNASAADVRAAFQPVFVR